MTDTTNHAATLYDITRRGHDLWHELNKVREAVRKLHPDDFYHEHRRTTQDATDALSLALNLIGHAADQLNDATEPKPVGELAAKVFAQTTAERREFEF